MFDGANNFTAIQTQDGVVHFKILTQGQYKTSGRTWYGMALGDLYYSLDGGSTYHKFASISNTSSILEGIEKPTDHEYKINPGYAYIRMYVDTPLKETGHIHFTNDRSYNQIVYPSYAGYSFVHPLYEISSTDQKLFAQFDWYIPESLHKEQNISFKLVITEHRYEADEDTKDIEGMMTYLWDKAHQGNWEYKLLADNPAHGANYKFESPEIVASTIAYDKEDQNAAPDKVAVMYTHKRNIHSYFDEQGNEHELNNQGGVFYVDAADYVRKQAKFKMREDYNNDSHEFHETESSPADIPAFHRIYGFSARIDDNEAEHHTSNVLLTWKVKKPKEKDLIDTDFFEIERATKPDFSDAESIALEMMETNPDDSKIIDDEYTYRYVDNSNATKAALSRGVSPSVYYRIRRASSAVWDWDGLGLDKYTKSIADGFGCAAVIDFPVYQAPLYYNPDYDSHRNANAKEAEDWATSRKIEIYGMVNPGSQELGENCKVVFDSTAPILLHKTMLLPDGSTSESVIEIPYDSLYIDDYYDIDWPLFGRLAFKYVDVADIPCVEYTYKLEIDTASAVLKGKPGFQYIVDVKNQEGKNNFKFDSGIKMKSLTASQGYFADQVFLQWETVGGMFDTYNIYAKDGSTWKQIGTTTDSYYNDKAAVGGVLQTYKVEGVLTCGKKITDSLEATGFRGVYGSISGRVAYDDNSGSPQVLVKAVPKKEVDVHKGSFYSGTNVLTSEKNLPESNQYTVSVMMKSLVDLDDLINSMSRFPGFNGNLNFDAGIPVTFSIYDLLPDKFVTITETFDGDSIYVYREGELMSKKKATFSSVGGKPFTLTSPRDGATSSTPIAFDELSIFNRALTPEEVKNNYNRMLAGNEEGLVAYFHFDETKELGRGYFYDNRMLQPGDEPFNLKLTADSNQTTAYSTEHAQDDHLLTQSYTNLDGSYTIGGLAFLSGTTYDITPTGQGTYIFNNNPSQNTISVEMSTDNCVVNNVNALNTASVGFSATVYFEGSTIPVYHANFLVNGRLVQDAAGNAIESDASGNVKFSIPTGQVTIQAVMDGHKFLNDGYVLENGKKELAITKPLVAEFWDQTKVRLTGRIVGGDDEAKKELYKNFSVNNLGDNLQFVLELEGDNVSHFVYDNVNHDTSVKTRDEVFDHTYPNSKEKHFTTMNSTLKRVTIHPDSLTGEYEVLIYPARYVVRQAYAEGYATLFPKGVTSQTVDLSNFHDRDTAVYSLTYHSPISLTYEQMLYGMPKDYLGEKTMEGASIDLRGYEAPLTITDSESGKTVGYTFGYPVFVSGKKYRLQVQAHEDYYYNNNKSSGKHSKVVIKGEDILVHNGMNTDDTQYTAPINKASGYAYVELDVNNPTFTMVGEDALRRVDMSVKVNGEYIACDPLLTFVTGEKTSGTDDFVTLKSDDVLIDILRDPQGAGSSAYIEEGSKYDFNYNLNLTASLGVSLNWTSGANISTEMGINTPISYTGYVMEQESAKTKSIPIKTDIVWNMRKSYSHNISERISTSSGAAGKNIGANGDVYIGNSILFTMNKVETIGVMDATDIEHFKPLLDNGMMKIIAEPTNDSPYYLTVSEKVKLGSKMGAKFAYSQYFIINTLLPKLVQQRDSILLVGSGTEIKALADSRNEILYRSLVDPEDENFGLSNYYEMVVPNNYQGSYIDRVADYNQQVSRWVKNITANEKIKYDYVMQKKEPWRTYSVQNGVNVTYSESATYSSGYNVYAIPIGNFNINSIFQGSIKDFGGGDIQKYIKICEDTGRAGIVEKQPDTFVHNGQRGDEYDGTYVTFKFLGTTTKFSIKPIVNVNFTEGSTTNESKTVSKGFTLSEALDSYEDIAVYRIESKDQLFKRADEIAFNYSSDGQDPNEHKVVDFLFLRKAGSTRNPYLGAETTMFYKPGTVLSPASLKIDNPKVTITQHEISNVPADQAAVFEIILSNETEITDGRKVKANGFSLYQEDASNGKGLKIFMDGQPLTDGRTFFLAPGDVVKKTIEVYRGSEYDYEDVGLTLMSADDITTFGTATFSVHYSRAGLPPTLTLPVNNWIMNTLSSKDSKGRYYIPVEIDNINPNDNFDHVELQYKLQTQGDDMWVNLCSYYADEEYYEKASGNKEMFEGTSIKNIKFYGENDPIEQRYDIRAVTFYRHGSSFVTASSEIRSGLKDTRVPQLFGAVTPKNGILGVGDYISIPFSEDIAANYLNKLANFEITGYTNARAISGNTSLQFDGANGSKATSAVTRNLHDKSFTIDVMVDPETVDRKMTYFAQGTVTEYVEFGQDGTGKLYIAMKTATDSEPSIITSKKLATLVGWSRVAVEYNNETGEVQFYQSSEQMTVDPVNPEKLKAGFSGVGQLVWGNNIKGDCAYTGRMLEARLWTKFLTLAEIAKTKEVHLSGFEKNLLAYYPMTEGVGDKAKDKANGATLNLNGQTWNLPRGLAMHISESDTLAIDGTKFNASDINDFTLSFWFRADEAKADTMALIASGRGVANEVNAEGRIFFGLAPSGNVVFQHNGALAEAVGNYADQNWHQVALTVNRAANLANLYVDDKLKDQLNASQIGSLSAGRIDIGRCDWTLVGDSARMEPQAKKYPFAGYIDDVVMWNAALPEQYMTQYYNQAPNGEEMALVNHLSFSQRKQNSSGIYETVYNPYNNKVVRDDNGNVKKKTDADRLILNSDEYASSLTVDQTAPITEKDNLEKLDFSFMGKDNELVINIDRLDKDINKQNIFVTVTDVEDLAGNPMASPLTWVVYVDRNQVRWSDSYVIRDLGLGETDSFRLNVTNTGATTMNYEITDLPEWLTVDKAWGSVGPATDIPLEFKVGNILDAGEHTAIIYITDQNGLSDPLSVTVNVKADEPEWEIEANDKAVSMSIVAQVTIIEEDMNGNKIEYLDTNTADLIGAFVNNKCIGKAHITIENGNPMVYLSARGPVGANIDFVLWRANTGSISILEGADVTVKSDALEGTPEAPIQLHTGESKIQIINLKAGWNWISFNIKPNKPSTGISGVILNDYKFTDGDVIKSDGVVNMYSSGKWFRSTMTFNHQHSYMIYVHNGGMLSIIGTKLELSELAIPIKANWNFLPYLCTETMSVTDAMSAYYDEGTPGDVIKSYDEFAVMTSDHKWVGSLTHMRPGVGYMIQKHKSGQFDFRYPARPMGSDSSEDDVTVNDYVASEIDQENFTSSAMPVLATVLDENGECAKEGDILKAYDGDALVGTAVADNEGRFFLMTHAEDGQEIRFTLSGNGRMDEIATKPILRFNASAVIGTYGTPYVIDFNATDEDNAVVYDLEGRRVNNTQNGNIYIKNNKKVIK